jgi:hypothetical protein
MAARCTPWKEQHFASGATAIVSTCGAGVELQVRPDDWAKQSGPSGYIVKRNGRIVRHGYVRTLTGVKKAARRQAGAKGGVP